jgi:hypothetical protein
MLEDEFGFAAHPVIEPCGQVNSESQNQDQNGELPNFHRFPRTPGEFNHALTQFQADVRQVTKNSQSLFRISILLIAIA